MTGCGPSPAYDNPEPRTPVAYSAAGEDPEPMTPEELAAYNAARGQQQQQVPNQVQAQPGDVQVGEDNGDAYSDTDPSALTEFRPALEGHGQWVDDPTYGTIWVPNEAEVGSDFVPYGTGGHWTYDDTSNYVWASDYSWGWAPFHYGRWVHARQSWAWIPGRQYAGAWVTWRNGEPGYGYVGWAPMGPEWYWYDGYAVGWTFGYTPYWSYCGYNNFWGGPGWYGNAVRGGDPRYHDIEAHTRPYNGGRNGEPGGRVAATPGVGGSGGRTAATPRVGGPAGPSPASLGMRPESVVAPSRSDAGLARAQMYSTPRTAMAAGAAAPAQRRRPDQREAITGDALVNRAGDRAPAGANPRLDSVSPVARSPQYNAPRTSAGSGAAAMASPRAFSGNGAYASAAPTHVPYASQGYRSAPNTSYSRSPSAQAYRSAPPSFRSAPSQTLHSSSGFSGSHFSSPSHSSSSHSSSRSSGGHHR